MNKSFYLNQLNFLLRSISSLKFLKRFILRLRLKPKPVNRTLNLLLVHGLELNELIRITAYCFVVRLRKSTFISCQI